MYAQCVTNINFSSWSQAGYTANGNWAVENAGSQIHQSVNGNPTFFISPFKLMGVKITGDFKTTDNDDDMMGFVFSFLNPLGQSDNYNGWLFDWKQALQVNGGFTAQKGKALCKMNGIIPSGSYVQTFWGHQNTPQFTVVQNDFGGAGWVKNFNHHFELRLTYTHAVIYIDGQLAFDWDDCYLPGYFGFYNYSQKECFYSNFNFEPYVEFSVLTPEICLGDTARFQFLDVCQDSSLYDFSTFQSLTWNFGDGATLVNNNININNINSTHVYSQPGTYSVTLALQDHQGCIGIDTQQIIIDPLPVVGFVAAEVCQGATSIFNNQSTITTGSITGLQWTFDDGAADVIQNPTHTYAACDTFNVKLIATSNLGCKDSITNNVIVNCLPVVNYNADTVCKNRATIFNNLTAGAISNWDWNFGDASTSSIQNPSHTYASCGTFNTKLIVTNMEGCKDSVAKTTSVNCVPVANFGVANVCLTQPMIFNDSSSFSGGSVTAWSWNFGDGTPLSTSQHTTHLFSLPGTYSVSLIASNNFGCKDTVTKNVIVYPLPNAQFSAVDVCDGNNVLFNDSSDIPAGNMISSWSWNFGDGSPLFSGQIVTGGHLYANPGTYTSKLTVVSNFGCIDSVTEAIIVHSNPVVDFNNTSVCNNNATQFNDITILASGSISSWEWNFGDTTTTVFTQNPLHVYSNPGSHTVTLIANTNFGCSDTISKPIQVHFNPIANFTLNEACTGDTIYFTNTSFVNTPYSLVNHLWSFGDGSQSSTLNAKHAYVTSGNYSVSLITTTNTGCTDTITNSAVAHPLPMAQYSALNVCESVPVQFINSSIISGNGSIQSFVWNFNDGITTDNNSNTSHLYTPGTHTAELIVVSDFGCADSVTKTIVVNPNPVPNFSVNDTVGCEPLCITFQNTSTITSGNNAQFSWNFGDGSPISTSQDLFHCYENGSVNSTAFYTPELTVTSDSGCVIELTKTNYITVHPLSEANFTTQPQTATIIDPVIYITDISTGASIWTWNYGDGTSSASNLSPYTYADTGAYVITLITSNQFNCSDTTYQTVIIEPDFIFYIPNVFTPNDDGLNDSFTGKGISIIKFEMTIFDRWGNLIYYTDNINKPWDGKVNHGTEITQQDVYVYAVNVTDFKNRLHKYKGVVTLIK